MLTNSQIADYERRLELADSRRYDKDDEDDDMGLRSAVKAQIRVMQAMLNQREDGNRLGKHDLQAVWLAVCVESAIDNFKEDLMDDASVSSCLRTAVEGQINYLACTLAYVFDKEQEVSQNPDQQVGALVHSIHTVIASLEYALDAG